MNVNTGILLRRFLALTELLPCLRVGFDPLSAEFTCVIIRFFENSILALVVDALLDIFTA